MGIIKSIFNRLTFNGRGDNHGVSSFGFTVGVVVDTDDPAQMGRIRVYCPDLNDDPKKPQHLPWAVYVSPFGGSIRNDAHAKGHNPDNATSDGVTQYGFWGIPAEGANVVVSTIGGDPRRRIWLGCLYEHQEVGGLFHGVYDWAGDDGTPDGPFSAPEPDFDGDDTKNKIEPLYTNQTKAFVDRTKPEWKTRGADYAPMVNVDIDTKGVHSELAEKEEFPWVKDKLGAAGYDWTSFKKLGSYLTSKVIGFVSPGLHSISFDDRPFNSRIKIRTTAGNQIILDDTNERIYLSTYEGKSWIEMDVAGNIDVFAERNISMRAKKDINFSTDESFRVKAKKGIFMYAGNSAGSPLEGEGIPVDGQIRFHSAQDTHFMTDGNMFQHIKGDMDFTLDGDFTGIVSGKYNLEIETDEYNVITPSNKFMINGSSMQLETSTLTLDGSSKVQIQGGGTNSSFSGSTVKLDASTVAFNDFGTTVGTIVSEHNKLVGFHQALATCAGCPTGATPITPSPQIVSSITLDDPSFEVDVTQIAPWTNRVPDHEPWPRVMKIDGGDSTDTQSDRPDYNIDWVDQYTDGGDMASSEPIGQVEGTDKIERGVFWRR